MPSGYTLPVFACASAIAALRHLQDLSSPEQVTVNLIKPAERVVIKIEQVARIDEYCAIAVTRSDPGDHLDITRHTPRLI
jgi:cobalt-precorrin-5B (C1)-methyltransferase